MNLLYTAPTSGGKTVVAEVLRCGGCRRAARTRRRLRAAVPRDRGREVRHFKKLPWGGINVAEYSGPVGALLVPRHQPRGVHDRALPFVHSLANEGRLHELKAVVVDEFYMVGKPQRRRAPPHALALSRKQRSRRRAAAAGDAGRPSRSAAASASVAARGVGGGGGGAAPQIIDERDDEQPGTR